MTARSVRPRRILTPDMFFKREYCRTDRAFEHSRVLLGPRLPFVLLVGIAVIAACGSNVPPDLGDIPSGLHVALETRFYEVHGLSPDDLEVAMVMHGPEVQGHPRYAATAFHIRWSFTVRESAAGCVVRSPRIELVMVEHLPEWADRDRADEQLRTDWEVFFEAVRTHERGHQQHNVLGAERMLRALRDAHSAGGCADLRRSADADMRALLARVHSDNHRFDLETGGGSSTGVRWPPPR